MLFAHIVIALMIAGPETPLTGPDAAVLPAAFEQRSPKVASNGETFLAVWEDWRETRSAIYLSLLDSDGRPLKPFATRVASGSSPVVTRDGSGYLIAWIGRGGATVFQRLDRQGNVLETLEGNREAAQICGLKNGLHGIVTNGRTIFVSTEIYCYGIEVVHQVFDPERETWTTVNVPVEHAAAHDGGYSLAGLAERTLVLSTVDDSGKVVTRKVPLPGVSDRYDAYPQLAVGDHRILVAWRDEATEETRVMVLDRAGSVIEPARVIGGESRRIGLLADGDEFLLLMRRGETLEGVRLAPNGTLRDVAPFVLSSAFTDDEVGVASNGRMLLLLWIDRRFTADGDVVSRAVPDLGALAQPENAVRLVSMAGRAQAGVQIAAAGSHTMAVWGDGLHQGIGAMIDGVELTVVERASCCEVSLPSVAAGDSSFLVAWKERRAGEQGARLLARRYAFDRSPLDGQPLVLAAGMESSRLRDFLLIEMIGSLGHPPGVAADGSSFVVAAAAGPNVRIARVDARSGAVATLIHEVQDDPELFLPVRVEIARPLRAGREWLVAYSLVDREQVTRISAARIEEGFGGTRDVSLFKPGQYLPAFFVAASALGRISFVWYHDTGWFLPTWTVVAQTTPDSIPLGEPARLFDDYFTSAALAWNGSEHLLAWSWNGSIRGLRLAWDGRALDSSSFLIAAPDVATIFAPAVAVTGDGMVVAWSRPDDAHGGVPRAFIRSLDPGGSIVRRRGVRH